MKIPFLSQSVHVAVIRLQGPIGVSARGVSLSDGALAPLIERAFRRRKPVAVAVALNSPGGSPAQSSLIAARIRRLSDQLHVPVHVFVEDVAASGGYWLACAGDKIWVDETTLLGSIGVIAAGFGFADLIGRHGIERRVHTAGKSKSLMDPFRPERPEDVERINRLLAPIHDSFKRHVQARRGHLLSPDHDLFTGDVWIGQQAVDLGLADGVAHLVPKMKEIFGEKTRFLPYGQRVPLLRRLGLSAEDFLAAAENRATDLRLG